MLARRDFWRDFSLRGSCGIVLACQRSLLVQSVFGNACQASLYLYPTIHVRLNFVSHCNNTFADLQNPSTDESTAQRDVRSERSWSRHS